MNVIDPDVKFVALKRIDSGSPADGTGTMNAPDTVNGGEVDRRSPKAEENSTVEP